MVTDQPLDHLTLAQAVGAPPARRRAALRRISRPSTPSRAVASTCATSAVAGGSTRGTTSPPIVEQFVVDGQQARLTQAALETLAVVAYRQPVSRARVSAIRGVNVDGVMRTLVSRGLVEEAGSDAETGAPPVPDDQLLPGADGPDAASTSCRRSRRSCPRWPRSRASSRSWPSRSPSARPQPVAEVTPSPADRTGVTQVRLQKVLAASGVASRRKCETLMAEGRVEVDGEVVTQLGAQGRPGGRGDPGRRQADPGRGSRRSTSSPTSRAAW